MIERIDPEVALEKAACMVEVACDKVSEYLRNCSGTVENEIIKHFSGTDDHFFIDDLRRFSVQLSSEDDTIEQYPTYIGLIIGAFVAEQSGFLSVVRHDLEAVTSDDDIRQRSLLYEQMYLSDFADPIEPHIPRPFDSAYLSEEFRNGTRAVIGETVAAIYEPELEVKLRLAKIGMEYDLEAFTSAEEVNIGKMLGYR